MFGKKVRFVNLRAIKSKEDGFKMLSYIFLRGLMIVILMFVSKKYF